MAPSHFGDKLCTVMVQYCNCKVCVAIILYSRFCKLMSLYIELDAFGQFLFLLNWLQILCICQFDCKVDVVYVKYNWICSINAKYARMLNNGQGYI